MKKMLSKLHDKKKSYNFAPQFRKEPTNEERCRSGRTGRSRKPLYPCGYLGFESLSFRECTHVHHQKKPVTIKVTGFYLVKPIVKNC